MSLIAIALLIAYLAYEDYAYKACRDDRLTACLHHLSRKGDL